MADPITDTPPAPATLDGLAPPPPVEPPPVKRGPGRPRGTTKKSASSTRKDSAPRSPGRPSKDEILTEKLADIYALLGLGVSWWHEPDGMAVTAHAEQLAASWVALSKENAAVARWLDRLTTTSAVGGVVVAHAGLALAIARNHGLAAAPIAAGGGPPDGFGPSPAPNLAGFDFSAIVADPDKVAKLGDVFGVDLSGAQAGNGTP